MIQTYTEEQIEEMLTNYILEEFMYDKPEIQLNKTFPLIEQGIIDSLGIFRFINFIDENLGFSISAEEVVLENFETIEAIKNLVISKMLNQ